MTQVKIEVLQSASQLLNKYRSLVVNLGEDPAHEASQTLRKSVQRRLSARLRFFRLATSTLMSVSFSSNEQSRTSVVVEALKEIREAFFQLQDSQRQLSSPKNISTEEILKLNVDVNDVREKLRSLNNTLGKQENVSEEAAQVSSGRDEL